MKCTILSLFLLALLETRTAGLSNYSLPYGGPPPYRGSPFMPPAQAPYQPPRNPYNPPTYLPPSPSTTKTTYTETNTNYYSYSAQQNNYNYNDYDNVKTSYEPPSPPASAPLQPTSSSSASSSPDGGYPPARPPGYTRVQGQGDRAQLHAVLDYDDDYYEDETDPATNNGGSNGNTGGAPRQSATPIQGPIFLKNGSVPVVPLYSYPVFNNGSLVQIPILWSALSVALGLEVRGQIIQGAPCVKSFHQVFCPTAGDTYPTKRIEHFIDENKALMKRMYGDFTVYPVYGAPGRGKRGAPGPDPLDEELVELAGGPRAPRQASPPRGLNSNEGNSSGRIDACESKMEIVTPYWALNSAGKVRAVVNTMHFEQAIHQEKCSKTQTSRCAGECGCEQKYKWHRLLAYDPDQDCAGIFMDWFLFPSCCVCRCSP